VKSVNSFVDSGATGEFINCHYAKSNRLHTQKLSEPIPVYNVDGTLNEAGSITEVVDLILRYQNHSEQTLFAVAGLGKQKLILGHSWLRKHNPKIDWVTGEVKMSRCPPRCCSRCRDKAQVERITWKAEIQWAEAVSDGPVPELHADSEEEEPEEAEEPIEPGDHIFAIGLVPAPVEIRATSSISQRLAEAFKRNSKASAPVKLGFWMEMSNPKLCEALASTCGLCRSLDGCLEFWRSGWSRRVQTRAKKKLKKGKSKLREVGC